MVGSIVTYEEFGTKAASQGMLVKLSRDQINSYVQWRPWVKGSE